MRIEPTVTANRPRTRAARLLLCLLGLSGFVAAQTMAVERLDGRFERSSLVIEAAVGVCYHFEVYLARSAQQRARGLMFVEAMPRFTGMLFWFPRGQQPAMWMRNTLISLDMLFLADDGEIVDIAARTEPHSLATITTDRPARWVLEINGALAGELGLAPGDLAMHPWFDRHRLPSATGRPPAAGRYGINGAAAAASAPGSTD